MLGSTQTNVTVTFLKIENKIEYLKKRSCVQHDITNPRVGVPKDKKLNTCSMKQARKPFM